MRELLTCLVLVSAGSLRICSSEGSGPKANASAEVAASASASTSPQTKAAPRFGGRVVMVGAHQVELLLHSAGSVEASVSDSQGNRLNSGVQLALSATATGGTRENISLAFDAPSARFTGHARAGVDLVSGPLELTLTLDGKPTLAKFASFSVLGEPELGGSVLLLGDYSAEVLARSNGELLVFLRDAAGRPLQAHAGLDLKASVHVQAGAVETLSLSFDPLRKCFAGRVKAGLELSPGPLELTLMSKGSASLGGIELLALRADAAHGGQVLVVGGYSLELLARGKTLQAFLFDASGKASAAADAALRLDFAAKPSASVSLAWDPAKLNYRGEVEAAIKVALEPLRVNLTVDGKAFAGAAASLQSIATARLEAGKAGAELRADAKADLGADAKLNADAKLGADAKLSVPNVGAKVSADAAKAAHAAANVQITPPKINIEKKANASADAKTGAKASAGFSFGVK